MCVRSRYTAVSKLFGRILLGAPNYFACRERSAVTVFLPSLDPLVFSPTDHVLVCLSACLPVCLSVCLSFVSQINFREEAGPCEYIVWYCRMLTSGFLKLNADRYGCTYMRSRTQSAHAGPLLCLYCQSCCCCCCCSCCCCVPALRLVARLSSLSPVRLALSFRFCFVYFALIFARSAPRGPFYSRRKHKIPAVSGAHGGHAGLLPAGSGAHGQGVRTGNDESTRSFVVCPPSAG